VQSLTTMFTRGSGCSPTGGLVANQEPQLALTLVRAQLACLCVLAEELGWGMTLAEAVRIMEQAEHALAVEGEQDQAR